LGDNRGHRETGKQENRETGKQENRETGNYILIISIITLIFYSTVCYFN